MDVAGGSHAQSDLWLRTFEEVASEYPDIEHFTCSSTR